MARFRFLHAADIHLDSPLTGLDRYDGFPAAQVRAATRRALERLVEIAIEQNVSFVILAGDLYDGSWKDSSTGLFMVRMLRRLTLAGIRVITLAGNHDAVSIIARDMPMPEGVDQFPSAAAGTIALPELKVALHGQSFQTRHVSTDMTPGYPPHHDGWLNIGVLHTSLSGYGAHETYAPCSIESLSARGYDYWALGHVHARQIVSTAPWIVFPGVLQGRHARETGACGAMLVEVDDLTITSVTPVACDVVRWVHLELDISDIETRDALDNHLRENLLLALDDAEGRTIVVRLTLTGRTALHDILCATGTFEDDLRAIALSTERHDQQIAFEKIRLRTAPPVRKISGEHTGELDEALEAALRDPDFLAAVESDLGVFTDAVKAHLDPAELHDEDGKWPIEQAAAALRARLLGEEG